MSIATDICEERARAEIKQLRIEHAQHLKEINYLTETLAYWVKKTVPSPANDQLQDIITNLYDLTIPPSTGSEK